MSAELNRRIAELAGWQMVNRAGFWNLATLNDPYTYIWISRDASSDLDDAWQDAFEAGALPDYSGDPSAALALLAGDRLLWGATAHNDYGDGTWIEFSVAKSGKTYWSEAEVGNGDEARAFAEAAALAWVSWKEAGE